MFCLATQLEILLSNVLSKLQKRLTNKGITIDLTPKAIDYLAKHGYDKTYGARPLNRLIQNKILNKVASFMVRKEFSRRWNCSSGSNQRSIRY